MTKPWKLHRADVLNWFREIRLCNFTDLSELWTPFAFILYSITISKCSLDWVGMRRDCFQRAFQLLSREALDQPQWPLLKLPVAFVWSSVKKGYAMVALKTTAPHFPILTLCISIPFYPPFPSLYPSVSCTLSFVLISFIQGIISLAAFLTYQNPPSFPHV